MHQKTTTANTATPQHTCRLAISGCSDCYHISHSSVLCYHISFSHFTVVKHKINCYSLSFMP